MRLSLWLARAMAVCSFTPLDASAETNARPVVAKDSLDRVWYADPGAIVDAMAASTKRQRSAPG